MEPKETQDMIDSTDSYEAATVMKSMKNFLFWLLLATLLVSQAIFWMDRFNLIDKTGCSTCPATGSTPACPMSCRPVSRLSAIVPLAAQNVIAEQVEQVVQKVDLQNTAEQKPETAEPSVVIEQPLPTEGLSKAEISETPRDAELDRLRISCKTAYGIVRICNFIMFMAAVLYCLTLLMNLKISLTGKLGGINHISQAFFWSLFMLVFLTPWQTVLPGVVVGAMYLPGEFLCGAWAKADTSTFWKVLLYLRFTGLWVIVVWMLCCSMLRSMKWAHATLRRLGMR
jgi:hypothetical protein